MSGLGGMIEEKENGHQRRMLSNKKEVRKMRGRQTHQENHDGEHHEEDGIPVLNDPSLQVG